MTKYKKTEVLAFQMKFFRQYTFIKEKIQSSKTAVFPCI